MTPTTPHDRRPRLVVEHVGRQFASATGPVRVLTDVSLDLASGETLAIVGPSGAGKSTLLNVIGSLDQAASGRVTLDGLDVLALRGEALADYRRRRVGFVFQDHHLLPQCTALENVLLPTLADRTLQAEAGPRAEALLKRMGMDDMAGRFPGVLSGGERQRVAIARALINRPTLVLADEPTGNLDRDAGEAITSLFLDLAREAGVMLILVTHNRQVAAKLARRMELRDGVLQPWEADEA